MTLIEVLAALMLLGSLAVAMLLSRGQLMDQHARSQQKLDAVKVADQLLADWWSPGSSPAPGSPETIVAGQDGVIEGREGWIWQTTMIRNDRLTPFAAQVVRLQILDTTQPGEPVELTSVDLIVPSSPGTSLGTSRDRSGGEGNSGGGGRS